MSLQSAIKPIIVARDLVMAKSAPTRSRDIAGELEREIRAGMHTPGGKLPTTRALAEQFAVSLPTIQSVLRQLEAQHLIECQPRQGCIITYNNGHVATRTAIAVIRRAYREQDSQYDNRINCILRCAEQAMSPRGYHLINFTHDGEEDSVIAQCLPRLDDAADDLAGVLCCSREAPEVLIDEMPKRDLPWLSIERSSERITGNYVTADNLGAGRGIGYCFAKLGYRTILFLSLDVRTSMRGMDFLTGLFQGYVQAGDAMPTIAYRDPDDFLPETGRRATLEYIDEHGPPDAIASPGDYLPMGALDALRERGLRVPEDVAVVGGAGLEVSNYTQPPLTVVRQPMKTIGRAAGEMMLGMIERGDRTVPGRMIPCQFAFRQSLLVPDELQQELQAHARIALGRQRTITTS